MNRKWWTLGAVCVATFMLLLDITVVNTALPAIQKDLGGSFTDLQWVIDAYALSLAALVLTAGSLADRLGRRRVFAIGLGIFSVASLLCALAPDPTFLNLARGLHRRAVGPQRPHDAGHRQHDEPRVPEQRHARRPHRRREPAPNDPRASGERADRDGGQPRRARRDSAIGLALGSVNGAFNLDVALSALERTGKGRVLSTPRLTTQNNIAAEVTQGIQIPIQTVANNTVTVTFKDAVADSSR